jgi:phospho-N-acetylmuramoyl-pentapeptide-transferase
VLYHLFYEYLSTFISEFNVFRYQTFRATMSFFFSFSVVLIAQPLFIKWLQRIGVKGQPIREDGPKDHFSKQGTPSMGGLVVVGTVVISSLLFCDLRSFHVWLTTGVIVSFAYLGFIDDWRKIKKQNSYKGLSERGKLLAQASISALAAVMLYFSDFPTQLTVPFFKQIALPLGVFFIPFVMLVVVATSNAVNLTDGLDGLAIGPTITVAFTYAVICYVTGHAEIARYLQLAHVPQLGEVSIILAAIIASGLGFLWYNTFPAQIFMGDTGALALGGVLGFVSVLAQQELLLIISGGVFVVEALSVIIQRYYFKFTKRRIFRMAPIHHHFELLGWAEPKIIVRFWIISLVLALLSLTTLKLR